MQVRIQLMRNPRILDHGTLRWSRSDHRIEDLVGICYQLPRTYPSGCGYRCIRIHWVHHDPTRSSTADLEYQSDESSLVYLYRLNVAGLCARLKIKDGSTTDRRKHMDHFIKTLEDPDLADRRTYRMRMFRKKSVIRWDRAKSRLKKAAFRSGKFKQKASKAVSSAPAKQVRAIRIQATHRGSNSEMDSNRRIYLDTNQEFVPKEENKTIIPDPGHQDPGSMNQITRSTNRTARVTDSTVTDARTADPKCIPNSAAGEARLVPIVANEVIRRIIASLCGELHDIGKCPVEEFNNQIHQLFNPTKHMDVKLGRSSGWNPIRAERSRYCIYAFVHKTSVDQVSKQRELPDNTCDLHENHTFTISSLRQVNEYARSDVTMTVDLRPNESRGYWKQQDSNLWFKSADQETTVELTKPSRIAEYRRSGSQSTWISYLENPVDTRNTMIRWSRQAKIGDKIHSEKAILLLNTGAEVFIVDTAFTRKVGCYIDSSQIQDCVGIGENVYRTEERTWIKVTLAGALIYFVDIWVRDLSDQEAILGMDFTVPAGTRLDLAHRSIRLPDEVRIQLTRRRLLYSNEARVVNLGQHLRIQPVESVELPLRLRTLDRQKFWVTRKDYWVPMVVNGPGKIRYMRITNVGEKGLILHQDLRSGIWLAGDHVPRIPGFISVEPRRWQNRTVEANVGTRSADPEPEDPPGPAVERPEYGTPRPILQWSRPTAIGCLKVGSSGDQDMPDYTRSDDPTSDKSSTDYQLLNPAPVASDESDLSSIADDDSISHVIVVEVLDDQDQDKSEISVVDPAAVEGFTQKSALSVQDLITLNRLDDIFVVKSEGPTVHIADVRTRSRARTGVRSESNPPVLCEEVIRDIRIERIRQAYDDEPWIHGVKIYLAGEVRDLTQEEARTYGSIAMNHEVDQHDLIFYCPTTKKSTADRDKIMRLVLPESLHQDVLHHYHTSLQVGHQRIGRTYDRIRDHFHWRGVYCDMSVNMLTARTGKGDLRSKANRRIIFERFIHSR
ncbi:LOW QUALITY PROTEIN: hypothetical protein PHMEG_0002391 [Phytophthora megakarya]|uniref:Integrase zinc-binding domain-containing protein n=1 Tax=Phytophthora megakarya TaxID=4795 RepID=A0A225X0J3_9STRA|nr:LOW QUALITY PROTEIN: hypothetical protein PHMEG_0002391 [Phytophthora megakarya]